MSKKAISWFKHTFHQPLATAVEGTPFSLDLLCAIAYQETGYIWAPRTGELTVPEILAICVGDTLDHPKRKAFPRNRAHLLEAEQGEEIYRIAREALLTVAEHVSAFDRVARKYPHKFCRGFGIFQYDLQFFLTDPDYFLQKKWHVFDVCVSHCVRELREAQRRQGWASKTRLTQREQVFVAIAYNRGRADLRRGFRQGHKSGGRYYGENIDAYLKTAGRIRVSTPDAAPAPAPAPAPIGVTSSIHRVNVRSYLNLRDAPSTSGERIARMLPGQVVQRIGGKDGEAWWELEARIGGETLRGFAASRYLEPMSVAPSGPTAVEPPAGIDFEKVPAHILAEVRYPGSVIEKGQRNKRVRRVQEWLSLHGFRTGIDGDFGPATLKCVRRFQESRGLPVTGRVTRPAWERLVEPMRRALAAPAGIRDMSLAAAVRAVARQHVEEHPVEVGGANRGPWVRLYCDGHDGSAWAWCAGFVSLIMHQACFYREESPPIEGSVSCDVLAAQAKARGLFVHESEITSGDRRWSDLGECALFLRRRTSTDWTHTGFAFDGDGTTFDTIEGNTNDEGHREGFEACRRVRSVSRGNYDFVVFAHPTVG